MIKSRKKAEIIKMRTIVLFILKNKKTTRYVNRLSI